MGSLCWVKSNEFGQDKKEVDHKYSLWAGMFGIVAYTLDWAS